MSATGSTAVAPASVDDVVALFARPLLDLVFEAARVHRAHHDATRVQCSQLYNVKTGGCPEDCGYCSQSAHHETPVEREPLARVEDVVAAARTARENGADRFCMGAAWREVSDGPDFERVLAMVREVKALGLETCVTLGMLKGDQALQLKEAGLDYYNHNLDTAPEFYGQIITTHTLADRLDTLDQVRSAGINVCSGGIVGMGEGRTSRAGLLVQLANMAPPPESVPINNLVPVPGTPLEGVEKIDPFEFVRTIAAARIMMPASFVRLSAGRQQMNDELQALCFLAGANSIFYGDRLLTTDNPDADRDEALFARLGLRAI